MARPSLFNDATAEEICIRIMCGDSLAEICRDEEMPAYLRSERRNTRRTNS